MNLTAGPSRPAAPPRVAASPCALECRAVHAVVLEDVDGTPADRYPVPGHLVVRADDSAIRDGRLDTAALRPD
jgi:flavin reductase (DIM6/NTAB) family NADH-FMN oxidoreductase RutF